MINEFVCDVCQKVIIGNPEIIDEELFCTCTECANEKIINDIKNSAQRYIQKLYMENSIPTPIIDNIKIIIKQ